MTDKEKLLKLNKLADAMYYAAQYLTTDASRLHKAMNEYHQFIIHEYFKEEPVSEDLPHIHHRDTLDEFAYQCAYDLSNDWAKETSEWKDVKTACKLGAQWQKEHLWKPADGDDLPEIDREVIALLDNGKVVFAHRPQEYWDGKNIITGKVTRNYPKTYDKGGWNISDVKFWLDVELPKEIEL